MFYYVTVFSRNIEIHRNDDVIEVILCFAENHYLFFFPGDLRTKLRSTTGSEGYCLKTLKRLIEIRTV